MPQSGKFRTIIKPTRWLGGLILVLILCPLVVHAQVANLLVFIEFGDGDLGLINTQTDQMVQVNLISLAGWPGSTPQHAWVTPEGTTLYVSVDGTDTVPASVVVLSVNNIAWDKGQADIAIDKVIMLENPGTPSDFPLIEQVDKSQPVANWGCSAKAKQMGGDGQPVATWTQPLFTLGHGPSFLPDTDFMYLTQWTDNRIRVINKRTHDLEANVDPLAFGETSRQTHGVNCNPSGSHCLGTGYFFDHNEVDVYLADFLTGELGFVRSINLCAAGGCAAFTHYTAWIDERFALTATMQFGPTSLTPPGASIIGPSVWLLDIATGSAEQIVGTASLVTQPGVFRSASDLQVVGTKLYVAEEDSLDGTFGNDGYISVFDIGGITALHQRPARFLKRFKPGEDLPADYCVSHSMSVTSDDRFLYVVSYACDYIVKIDTATDTVVKVYGVADGVNGPHGAFMAGRHR